MTANPQPGRSGIIANVGMETYLQIGPCFLSLYSYFYSNAVRTYFLSP